MAKLDKGSKKILKEPDPFFLLLTKVSDFAKSHWKWIALFIFSFAILIGIAYSVNYIKEKKESSAWIAFFDVFIAKEREEATTRSYEEVLIGYPGTTASILSALEISSKLYEEGRYDLALEYLQDVKNDLPPFIKISLSLLKAKILEKMGRINEAIGIYEELILNEDAVFLGTEPFVQAAILYLKSGNPQSAVRILSQGTMRFQKGFEHFAILLHSFARLIGFELVKSSELP